MNSKSGGFLISSVWLRGADFLPDSSTARAGNPDRVFLKAHSGRGILYSGHRYLIPSIFSATTRERAPLAVWHLLGEMTMRIDRFHHRWQTRRENIALGLLINICSWDGWSIPASDPLTQNATTCWQELLRRKCPPSICSDASARFPVPFQQSPVSSP